MMPTMQEIDERENRVKYSPYLHALLAPIFAAARRGVEADQTIAIWQVEIRDRNETIASLKAELAALKVERDEAVRREREAISKMAADLEEGQSVTTKLVLRLLTDRIRARKGEHDEQH